MSISPRNTQEKDERREYPRLAGIPVLDNSPESGSPSRPAESTEIQEVISRSSQEDQDQRQDHLQSSLSSSPSTQPNIEVSSPRATEEGTDQDQSTSKLGGEIEEGSSSSSSEDLSKPDIEMDSVASEELDVNKEAHSPSNNTQDKAEFKEDSHLTGSSVNGDSLESGLPSNPKENEEIKEETSPLSQGDQNQGHDQDQPQPSSAPSNTENSEDSSSRADKEGTGQEQDAPKEDIILEEGSSSSSDESLDDNEFEMDFVMVNPEVKRDSRSRNFSYDPEDQSDSVSAPLLRGKSKDKRLQTLAKNYLQQYITEYFILIIKS